jgi:phage terminase large subunit-like protein
VITKRKLEDEATQLTERAVSITGFNPSQLSQICWRYLT